jgi:hypothetical protein
MTGSSHLAPRLSLSTRRAMRSQCKPHTAQPGCRPATYAKNAAPPQQFRRMPNTARAPGRVHRPRCAPRGNNACWPCRAPYPVFHGHIRRPCCALRRGAHPTLSLAGQPCTPALVLGCTAMCPPCNPRQPWTARLGWVYALQCTPGLGTRLSLRWHPTLQSMPTHKGCSMHPGWVRIQPYGPRPLHAVHPGQVRTL